MNITCKLFGHKWNGCQCSKCGNARNEEHQFILLKGVCIEKCDICNKERVIGHKWNGCKCSHCDKFRDSHHSWVGCKCTTCSKIRTIQHKWNGCKCDMCGKVWAIAIEDLEQLKPGMLVNDAIAVVGTPDFSMEASFAFSMIGFVPQWAIGKENWVYNTPYGQFQLIVQDKQMIFEVQSIEGVIEKIRENQ